MTRAPGRQAVVVVHGIGEQRPMSTVSGYIGGLCQDHDLVFSAPDEVSAYRDLQRVKVTWLPQLEDAADGSTPLTPTRTDFYELFWANLVVGTEWRHVTSWLAKTLRRWRQLGPRFRRFLRYHVVWAALLLVLAIGLFIASFYVSWFPGLFRWVGVALAPVATGWILLRLGDVARYVDNVGDNVTIQRAVRREGVRLLRDLHAKNRTGSSKPMYDRIVVVGHSLGSVVAYDIVRDYWTEVYRYFGTSQRTDPEVRRFADDVEHLGERLWETQPSSDADRDAFRAAQRRLSARWRDLVSLPPGEPAGVRWAVTDLITLACPLTHADLLLAANAQALEREQWNRGMPSCPPRRQSLSPSYRYGYVTGPRRDVRSWHQAAPFAATRWTNAYFETDIVGGPLRSLFGPGISDVELAPPRGIRGKFPMIHTRYDSVESALGVVRGVIWDYGRRADPESLRGAQLLSLLHVVRELTELPPDRHADAVAAAPLLRRYEPEDQQRLCELLAELAGDPLEPIEGRVAAAVADRAALLSHIVIAHELLDADAANDEEPEEEGFEQARVDRVERHEEVEEQAEQAGAEEEEEEQYEGWAEEPDEEEEE